MTKLCEDFIYNILSIVEEIPKGYVATYGQIASLAGYDKNSRLVGKVLKMSNNYGNYPCHRVVNSNGEIAKEFKEQKQLLMDEKVIFKNEIKVDLRKCRWLCD